MRLGRLLAVVSCCVNLVIGSMMSTTSSIWNRPCFDDLIGFWPVIISIGMPPSCAYAPAVTRLVAPGPSVASATPALPVCRP